MQTLAISHRARHMHRRKRKSVAVLRGVVATALQQLGIGGTGDHLRTRVAHELRDVTGMIKVRMRIENPFDVPSIRTTA